MMLEFDTQLLAKLFRESDISNCKTNQVKRDRWKRIAEEYSREKNIKLIDHKKLARKWGRLVKAARKRRSDVKKEGSGNEEDHSDTKVVLENELVLSAVGADFEPKSEPNEEDTEGDHKFEDKESQNSIPLYKDKGRDQDKLMCLEVQEQDPFLDSNQEVESKDSGVPDEEDDIDDEKFIRRVRMHIAVQELEKMRAENFTAQLRRNMAIAEYNKALGKNIPLLPLPAME